MENILSIEIDGEIFRYINNTWVDSMYCEAPGNILNQIYDNLIERADETSYETLLEYAKVMKNSEHYAHASQLIDYLIKNCDKAKIGKNNILLSLIPMKTSCLRAMHSPRGAIEFFNKIINEYDVANYSSALYTSIAAAYCDIDDYNNAIKYARRACAINTQEKPYELISVIKRIQSVLGQDCFND